MTIDVGSTATRRDVLRVALAAAVVVVCGCQSSGRSASELDRANVALQQAIADISGGDERQTRLASIASRISAGANDLVGRQTEFVAEFDALSRKADTTETQLRVTIEEYRADRIERRNELFRLQDELHAAMTDEEWAEVSGVLNRTARATGRPTVSEG